MLDFENLHISKKVKKLLNSRDFRLCIDENIDEVAQGIQKFHKCCWLSPRYVETLKKTRGLNPDFKVISYAIKEDGKVAAGEIGYTISKTYTSLSGFCHRDRQYTNYGKVQLVLLAQYLQEKGFDFWNRGPPHMDYKHALGTKVYAREAFLERWFRSTQKH
ncbi:MAG: hypothetical protein U9Q90_04435 [Campylobacterota bacterium]|nr:hypothetical protein [Campylobacterota bacterium]